MSLPFFSYSPAGGIIVSIQVSGPKDYWGDCPATLHECRDWSQAVSIAQAISNVNGVAVRMCRVNNTHLTQEDIGSRQGNYFVPKHF